MNANSHGTAKRGEKRHWQDLIKVMWRQIRLNWQRYRLYNWKTLSSSFFWVSFLGCLQQCSVFLYQDNLLKRTTALWSPKRRKIVHAIAFAWFHNWVHQNNASWWISYKFLQQKYGRQRKLNYTSFTSAFSLAKKLNLISLKHRNCDQVTGWSCVEYSVWGQHVVWSEAKYFYSWHLAKQVIFNCIIQPINSWIKITRKISFIGLAVQ